MPRPPDENRRHPRCCDRGWLVIKPGTIPTVAPCARHRALLHALWAAGCFAPEVPDYWRSAA